MYKWMPFAAAVPLLVGCQTIPGLSSSSFDQYDEDQDGVISRQEAQEVAVLSQNFQRMDTNSSGGIDQGEYAAAQARISGLEFGQVDINGDGVISEREADAMPDSLKSAFSTVDADSDGNVSETEYRAATVNLLSGLQFNSLDRDGDNVIDESEAERAPILAENFDRVDTDADGFITDQELSAATR